MGTVNRSEPLRTAIGAMSAWCLDGPRDCALSSRYLEGVVDGNDVGGLSDLTLGLLMLAGLLLSRRACEEGVPELETLRQIACTSCDIDR